jgi:hypothetical protein
MPATYEKIATTTLGTASATITFSTISAAYTDIKLIMTFTGTSNQFDMRFNSDTGSNYSWTRLKGDGASALSNRGTSSSTIATNESAGASAPQFVEVDIFSYAGSTNKTVLLAFSNDLNGSGSVGRIVGLWRNTSAISTITIIGSSYPIGTTATLYGILKA